MLMANVIICFKSFIKKNSYLKTCVFNFEINGKCIQSWLYLFVMVKAAIGSVRFDDSGGPCGLKLYEHDFLS